MKRLSRFSSNAKPCGYDQGGIQSIRRETHQPSMITFDSGVVCSASCLRCPDYPCVKFSQEEINNSVIEGLPFHPDNAVCPFDAIEIGVSGKPEISDSCLGCGLCASRCPVGAIFLSEKSASMVAEDTSELQEGYYRTTRETVSRANVLRSISFSYPPLIPGLTERIEHKCAGSTSTMLARNLLLCLGLPTLMCSPGNTNARIDLVFQQSNNLGIVEVELGRNAAVEAPRNILTDLAVCISRYEIDKKNLIPLIICTKFPNSRSDFYRVLGDIQSVLGIKVGVLSVGALFAMLWEGVDGARIDFTSFQVTDTNPTIIGALRSLIGDSSLLYEDDSFMAVK